MAPSAKLPRAVPAMAKTIGIEIHPPGLSRFQLVVHDQKDRQRRNEADKGPTHVFHLLPHPLRFCFVPDPALALLAPLVFRMDTEKL